MASKPVVIVADSSPTRLALMGALLSDLYAVVGVMDRRDAEVAIRSRSPEAILSDLQVACRPGDDLLRAVKQDPALQHIPFILVTSEEHAALRSMEVGADDFLARPFGPEELRARVAAAVRSFRLYADLRAKHAEAERVNGESKLLAMELHQAQKLEAVGRLAAGIAHEINTPIQYIGDNARFLSDALEAMTLVLERQRRELEKVGVPATLAELDRLAEDVDLPYLLEQGPRAVARTLEGVQRVATIVGAMKEFAHPDQKQMVPTDLNRALAATLEVARNEYKYVANVETAFGEVPQVTCHAGDVNQVFLNLIVNAAHAIGDVVGRSGAKGRIRLTTEVEGQSVLVCVSDTGAGIPEGIRDKIFEPFFTTKGVGRGTGQGLAIARNVVEKHGGTIRFETEPGKGTTFQVRLPLGLSEEAST